MTFFPGMPHQKEGGQPAQRHWRSQVHSHQCRSVRK